MNRKQRVESWFRGWLPKEPKLSNAMMVAQAPIMSEREKAYKRRVASVFLGVSGVLFGWGAAGYAYFYFSKIGVTAYASIYAVIAGITVLGIIWLIAFNLKRIQQYFTKELKA